MVINLHDFVQSIFLLEAMENLKCGVAYAWMLPKTDFIAVMHSCDLRPASPRNIPGHNKVKARLDPGPVWKYGNLEIQ